MQVTPVKLNHIYSISNINFSAKKKDNVSPSEKSISVLDEINFISDSNRPLVKTKYSLGLSHDELVRRTSKDALYTYKMLNVDSPEYLALEEGDKKALNHLLKAGKIIDEIYLALNNHNNIGFRNYLDDKIKQGSEDAKMTKTLFDAQKSIFARDNNGASIKLEEKSTDGKGKGFYPSDLSEEEFHKILIKMLEEGKKEEVQKILNGHSVVERLNDELLGIDFADKFKNEFNKIADELQIAASYSTNEKFNEYLTLQAAAMRTSDPMAYAYADYAWSKLQDTPLEFSFTRESYEDLMTPTVLENKKLKHLLEQNEITPVQKDTLGGRVGLINKEGTKKLLQARKYIPLIAKKMPLSHMYRQNISGDYSNQTIIDADIINLFGDEASCSAGIVAAQNLPNNDKPSIQVLGGGRRNVYHRQIMKNLDTNIEQVLDAVIAPRLHKYYNEDALTLSIAGHENGHSLGPVNVTGLGKYKSIIEEAKADIISAFGADVLNKKGIYSDKMRDEMLFCYVRRLVLKGMPEFSSTHRVKDLMQLNYLREKEAVWISADGILDMDMDKTASAVSDMLTDVIEIQLSSDINKAKSFVEKYYVWDEKQEKLSDNFRKASSVLNARIEAPLSDKLLSE